MNDISVSITCGSKYTLHIRNNNYSVDLPLPFSNEHKYDYEFKVKCNASIIASALPAREIPHLSYPFATPTEFVMRYRERGLICVTVHGVLKFMFGHHAFKYDLSDPEALNKAKSFAKNEYINMIRSAYKIYRKARNSKGGTKATHYT